MTTLDSALRESVEKDYFDDPRVMALVDRFRCAQSEPALDHVAQISANRVTREAITVSHNPLFALLLDAQAAKQMPKGCTTPSGCQQHGCHGECLPTEPQRPAKPVQEPVCRDDGMPTSAEERHLRRLLALRAAMPHAYYDDGEAQGTEHGIIIDFMREPVAHIDAKLRALNVARAIAKQSEPAREPVGYLPAYELNRLQSGHDGRLRSAKFGASALDGDVAVYTAPPPAPVAQQEPVAWLVKWANAYDGEAYTEWQKGYDAARSVVKAHLPVSHTQSHEPKQPEPAQEPYCYVYEYDTPLGMHRTLYPKEHNGKQPDRAIPLYTSPPQRKPLTEEEIGEATKNIRGIHCNIVDEIARAVERAHKIGGEG